MPLSKTRYGRKDKYRAADSPGITSVDGSTKSGGKSLGQAALASIPTLTQAVRAAGGAGTGGGAGGTGNTSGTNNIGGGPPAGIPADRPLGSDAPYSGDPYTGFASRYLEGDSMANQIFNNPSLVLQDVLRYQGINDPMGKNSGYYNTLQPLADIANELLLLQNNVPGGISNESAINYMASLFNNASTVGGRAPSFDQLIGNMLSADQGSPLGAFLGYGLDYNQQIKNFMNLGQAASEVGLHPYYADAFNAVMATAANDFLNQVVTGQTQANFADFFANNYAGSWGLPGY